MADVVAPSVRSHMMAGIRGKNTKPEMMVRLALHARGYRYRLHREGLPGRPDLVLSRFRAAIFVNGCFWHKHDCHLFKWPNTRREFWQNKLTRNAERDALNIEHLHVAGWRTCVIWECALKGKYRIALDDVVNFCVEWIEGDKIAAEIRGYE